MARLSDVERKILAALETGPKSLGELLGYHLRDIRAVIRDQAIAELLKAGRVRLSALPPPHPGHQPLPAIALARKGGPTP